MKKSNQISLLLLLFIYLFWCSIHLLSCAGQDVNIGLQGLQSLGQFIDSAAVSDSEHSIMETLSKKTESAEKICRNFINFGLREHIMRTNSATEERRCSSECVWWYSKNDPRTVLGRVQPRLIVCVSVCLCLCVSPAPLKRLYFRN